MKRKFLLTIIFFLLIQPLYGGVIQGTIYDIQTGEPISYATVRVEGTTKSTVSNQTGQYRIRLEAGSHILKFSHVAYYSDSISIQCGDSAVTFDVKLQPALHLLKGMKVYERAYDPAQRIIIEAISRKEKLLARLRSYSFEAYTKLVVRHLKKMDSVEIAMITETQLESFWQPPDKHKEIITARRQSSNFKAEANVIGMGKIIDFNENRIDEIVSPTAKDALDYYNYYLIDTIYYDGHPIFRLEFEPKSQSTPLFVGTVDIADSSFAVAGVDVGYNKAVDIPMLKNFRYSQRCVQLKEDYWMPVEAHASGLIEIPLPHFQLSFEMAAAMHDYHIDIKHPKDRFDEYLYEVAEKADDIDSIAWDSGQLIPLTLEELKGYRKIDSLEKAPKPFRYYLMMAGIGAMYISSFEYDIFHFNRVEGPYLGFAYKFENLIPRADMYIKSGWAFKGEYWQHRYRLDYSLLRSQGIKAHLEYHDEIVHRPTVISRQDGNPTIPSIFDKTDPYDYYLEKGFTADLSASVFDYRTKLSISYNDFNQYSVANATEYSFFASDKKHRPNPAIENGHLRSLSARFSWRTIELFKNKRKIQEINSFPFTSLTLDIEKASPQMIANDFNFIRYSARLRHSRRLFGLGISSLDLYAGASEKNLPPQKYFMVDCAAGVFHEGLAFKTMGEKNFAGNRTLMAYFHHDFGRLFLKSGLPLIRKIPLTASIYGGAFWSDFGGHDSPPDNSATLFARRPYREIGFGLGGITPYKLGCYFTWQLSDYPTYRFAYLIGIGM